MSFKVTNLFVLVCLLGSLLLSSEATAQMRPECGEDSSKPGACFDTPEPFNAFVGCDDGIILWIGISGDNDFQRTNPDSTIFVHNSDDDVITAFCLAADINAGLCNSIGDPGVFFGSTTLDVNGVISAQGAAQCPFVLKSRGDVTRDNELGNVTVSIKADFHLVPAPKAPGGCRFQQCRLVSPVRDNDQ